MKIAIVNVSDIKKKSISIQTARLSKHYTLKLYDNLKEKRINNLIAAYNDPSVMVILCRNGGVSCIDLINPSNFSILCDKTKKSKNKLIIGYSDCNHLLLKLDSIGYNTCNGYNLSQIINKDIISQITKLLSKEDICLNINLFNNPKTIRGKSIACNLQIITTLLDEIDLENKILFLESHKLDKKMVNYYFKCLKYKNIDTKLKAIVLGNFCIEEKEEIYKSALKIFKIPIIDSEEWYYLPNNRDVIIKKML